MSSEEWYYSKAGTGNLSGPFSRDEIAQLVQSGQLRTTDYVWKTGMEGWVRLKSVESRFAELRPVVPSSLPDVVPPGEARRDLSVGSLLLSNLVTIGIALVQQWPVSTVMWIYWFQSVIIGIFSALRMARLRNFSTKGFTSNGQPVPETQKGKMSAVKFFLIHYNGFHAMYLLFLLVLAFPSAKDTVWILAGVAVFFVNHLYSFRRNIERDLTGRPNLGTMMFLPYARVFPMHFCIGMGVAASQGDMKNVSALTVFMLMKTGADVLMHVVEHRLYRKT